VRRRGEGYVLEEEPSLRQGEEVLPEVRALLRNSGQLGEGRMKVCVTGPYTLSSLFPGWDESLFTPPLPVPWPSWSPTTSPGARG